MVVSIKSMKYQKYLDYPDLLNTPEEKLSRPEELRLKLD